MKPLHAPSLTRPSTINCANAQRGNPAHPLAARLSDPLPQCGEDSGQNQTPRASDARSRRKNPITTAAEAENGPRANLLKYR